MSDNDWSAQLRNDSINQLEKIQQMQRDLAEVSGEAEAARGLVKVRVTPAGMPTRLHLDPEATRLPADELSAAILAAIGDATVKASEQMRAIVGTVIPADDLDAMMRGTVSDSDRESVREQLDALRAEVQ